MGETPRNTAVGFQTTPRQVRSSSGRFCLYQWSPIFLAQGLVSGRFKHIYCALYFWSNATADLTGGTGLRPVAGDPWPTHNAQPLLCSGAYQEITFSKSPTPSPTVICNHQSQPKPCGSSGPSFLWRPLNKQFNQYSQLVTKGRVRDFLHQKYIRRHFFKIYSIKLKSIENFKHKVKEYNEPNTQL